MKKTIIMILTASLLMLTACSTETTTTNNPSLEHKGLELIAEVDTLAENEEYIKLFSGSPELEAIISDIAKEDYSSPKEIFIIEDLEEIVLQNMLMGESLSEDVRDIIKGRLVHVLPSQINAMGGVNNIAATNILAHGDNFIFDGLNTDTTYLYTFNSSYSFMVTFAPNNENIVNANVTVVINEELANCETVDEVKAFLSAVLDFEEVSVSTATEEK